jgi:hypothetical protein
MQNCRIHGIWSSLDEAPGFVRFCFVSLVSGFSDIHFLICKHFSSLRRMHDAR